MISALRMRLLHTYRRVVAGLYARLGRVVLPGFRGVPLGPVVRYLLRHVGSYQFSLRASGMAFNFFFAVFPAVVLAFSLLPYLPIADLAPRLLQWIADFVPTEAFVLIEQNLGPTLQRRSLVTVSVAFVLTLVAALRGVRTMLWAFSRSHPEVFKQLGGVQIMLRSLLIFMVVSLMLVTSVLLVVGLEWALAQVSQQVRPIRGLQAVLLTLGNAVANVGLLMVAVAFIYRVGTRTQQRRAFFSPGALVGGVLLVAADLILKEFFHSFGSYDRLYGPLAAVMVFMAWFYYISVVLLLGFELNYAIDRAWLDRQRQQSPAPDPALA